MNLAKHTAWTYERIYHDGDEYFADVCKTISHARESIDLEMYIFDRDKLGAQVLHALSEAARRGVRVRLLLDGVGSAQWSLQDLNLVRRTGAAVKFYHPLPWQNPSFSFFRYIQPHKVLSGIWKLNRRNHRKTCVVDHQVAFLGGLNISARHSRRESGEKAWRDTAVQVRGEGVGHLTEAFEHAWSHSRSLRQGLKYTFRRRWKRPSRLSIRPTQVRLNISRRQRHAAYVDLICRILNSKKKIWITNPYFVPDFSLIRALRFAAWSGTDVCLVLPKKNDIWGIQWAIKGFYFLLLSSGVRIFEYEPSILHAKVILIDQWAIVGSSNLNHRSFFQDLEVDVVLSRASSIRALETQFLEDLKNSKEVELLVWKRRSWFEKVLEQLALKFKRWL